MLANDYPKTVVWRPIPGSSQELALVSPAQHTLYTGARGPGKTDTQLMRFRRNVGMGYGSYWRGIIFDREYKNLDDLVNKSKRWFTAFGDGARFKESSKDYKWVWPGGEELLFRAVKVEADYWDFHGQEYPFLGWNELTKFPTSELYDLMESINRSSYRPEKDGWIGGYVPRNSNTGEIIVRDDGTAEVPRGPNNELPKPIPLEIFSTANPWGAGHGWVKRKFIDVAKYGELFITESEVFNPQKQCREKVQHTQVAVFGSYRENIYLDPVYVAKLEAIKDKNKRKAWLAGSWDIVAGGAIDDLWDKDIHIIPRFEVPKHWKIDRALDWGQSKPFSIGWFTIADGETSVKLVNKDKVIDFIFAKNTIIQINEWYGSEKIGDNKGISRSAKQVAEGIIIREALMKGSNGTRKWINADVLKGPADNQIGQPPLNPSDESIKTVMSKNGVHWTESIKNKGSRIIGLQLCRDRLQNAIPNKDGTRDGPAFYVTDNCAATIQLLPTLPRDEDEPDDIDSEAEDHVWDMIRYRLLAGVNKDAKSVPIKLPS